jgi:23S rRNA U2552 (ribose-2'-O)-methylase RlmE/FtsJ
MKKNVDSIKKAINLIRSIHLLHRTDEEKKFGVIMHKGFMHGDYTLENIIKKDDILKVIDIDDFSNCDYQIFDILSLLLHYFSITKKEKSIDLVNDLLSKDTYSLIKLYDDNIPYKILKELWILFLQKEIEKTQNYRESKSFFYNEILLLLSK